MTGMTILTLMQTEKTPNLRYSERSINMLFEDPKLNIICFDVADVLTVSGTDDDYSGPIQLPEIPG